MIFAKKAVAASDVRAIRRNTGSLRGAMSEAGTHEGTASVKIAPITAAHDRISTRLT